MPTLQPVDRLEFQILIDNLTDSLSTAPPNVTLEWTALMRAGMRQLSGRCQCCANHGLAVVVKAFRGAASRVVLFDAGPVEFAVEYNGTRLGIDFASIDAVVLSHGHWDHAGGLPIAFDLITKANGGRPVPCYLHPGMFRQRALPLAGGGLLPIREIPSPSELVAKGAVPVVTTEAQVLLDDMFLVSGEIPRMTSYEKGFPGHKRRSEDGQSWEDDPLIIDERFLAVHVGGKGIVVLTACSHAGIINVLRHAQSSFPAIPLYAVAGGFHLAGGNEKIIAESVRDIGTFGLTLIAPGHCTGWRAVNALANAYGDSTVAPLAVGKIFAI
ncbi:MBL fold metallo-hydrolase [Rhizobium sp. BR 314]|uniref:MBL fold metallo-hydrolase n=1 Tax=Rhizobium sp. BR 314 TaxID=3040013 RepID=UPI0039BFD6B3